MRKGCLTIIVIFLLANLVFILLGLKVQKNDEYITSLNKEIAESYKSKGFFQEKMVVKEYMLHSVLKMIKEFPCQIVRIND